MDRALEVKGEVTGLQLSLVPFPPIAIHVRPVRTGRKRKEGQSSVPIQTLTNSVGISISSDGATLNPMQYGTTPETTGSEQRQVVANVEPGTYRVEVSPLPGWYTAGLQSSGVDLFQSPMRVHAGARQPIDVELRDDGAGLQVAVSSEDGASAAGWFLLVPNRAPAEARVSPASLNAPAFISDLAPGSYSVLAFDHIDGLEYKNYEALREYIGQSKQIELAPGQDLEVKVDLIHRPR